MDGMMIVDLQNDYFPGGKMQLVGIDAAAANARLLLDACRRSGRTVIHVQHLSVGPGATFFLPGTEGAQIHTAIAPQEEEAVVVKNYPNAFRDTALLQILRKRHIDNILICGAMSHMCIDATVRAAFDQGFTCTLAEDACATTDLTFTDRVVRASDVHASFMAALSGTYASVSSTAAIIESLNK